MLHFHGVSMTRGVLSASPMRKRQLLDLLSLPRRDWALPASERPAVEAERRAAAECVSEPHSEERGVPVHGQTAPAVSPVPAPASRPCSASPCAACAPGAALGGAQICLYGHCGACRLARRQFRQALLALPAQMVRDRRRWRRPVSKAQRQERAQVPGQVLEPVRARSALAHHRTDLRYSTRRNSCTTVRRGRELPHS